MRQQLIVLLYFILNNFVQSSSNPNDFVQRRVAHGTRPPSFTYPYTSQVRLALIHRDSNRYTCTGTIITDMVVLTAAHCLKDFVNITVGYNGFTIQALTLIKAKRWFVHPFYQTKDLDIGLIETETSMKLTSSIQASYQGRWITSTAELAAHSKPSVLCGWGEHENRVAGDLSCIKFTRLDQACLLYQHDPEFSWCFYYPRAPNGGENTYTNVCYGDSGAGIFPDYEDGNWKLYAVAVKISQTNCEGAGDAIGHQITPNISDWIIDKVKMIHGNNCSLRIEL